MFQFIHLHI